jgi:uncharacterized membrane protein (UPF0127 family)
MRRAGIGIVLLGLVACEPRAPEPVPSARKEVPAPRTTELAQASADATKPQAACVDAWPDKPVREVKGTVPDPNCPDDPGPVPELGLGVVRFPDVAGLEVAVEIAKRNAERMRGLMYRKELGDNAGMLFIFEEERALEFWMKNTCIPLDMIFISDKGVVVGIEENTPTLSTATFGPSCPARFVLEVNAGWARKHGVRPGMRVDLPR